MSSPQPGNPADPAPSFVPVNNLEIQLRAILADKNTPSWNFYTPLAAATLWLIVRHYPELDGSDLIAPGGKNPDVCVFSNKEGTESIIGLYTAESRVKAAFATWQISPAKMIWISASGYQVLRLVHRPGHTLVMNFGIPSSHYTLDPDMVEILLSRPEPAPEEVSSEIADTDTEPHRHLGPLREFLSQQPNVRAAWVLRTQEKPVVPRRGVRRSPRARSQPPRAIRKYDLMLLMRDPEDESLLKKVEIMAKALTPVEMEWSSGLLMADDDSLRSLAKQNLPLYTAPDFLRS